MAISTITAKDDEEQGAGTEGGQAEAPQFAAAAPQQQAPGGQRAPTETSQKGSGTFTNFDKFIEANADKSQQFAKDVSSNLTSGVEGVVTKGGETFKSQIGQAEGAGPVNVADISDMSSPSYSNAQKALTASYNVEPWVGLLGDAGALKQRVENTSKSAGLGTEANAFRESKGINARQGESSMSNMLLRRDTGAQKVFGDLRATAPSRLDNLTALKQKAETAAKTAADLRGSISQAAAPTNEAEASYSKEAVINSLLPSFNADVQSRLAEAGTSRNVDVANVTQEQIREALAANVGNTYADSLSDADLARVNALRSLSGQPLLARSAGYVAPRSLEELIQEIESSAITARPGGSATGSQNLAPKVIDPNYMPTGRRRWSDYQE
jgi:hypothetical protein